MRNHVNMSKYFEVEKIAVIVGMCGWVSCRCRRLCQVLKMHDTMVFLTFRVPIKQLKKKKYTIIKLNEPYLR